MEIFWHPKKAIGFLGQHLIISFKKLMARSHVFGCSNPDYATVLPIPVPKVFYNSENSVGLWIFCAPISFILGKIPLFLPTKKLEQLLWKI